jgi:hypothetical protein
MFSNVCNKIKKKCLNNNQKQVQPTQKQVQPTQKQENQIQENQIQENPIQEKKPSHIGNKLISCYEEDYTRNANEIMKLWQRN